MNQQITTVLDSLILVNYFPRFSNSIYIILLMGHKWIKGQEKKPMKSNV